MNLVEIEEHQAGDLVFTQVHYLYILLEATSACVNRTNSVKAPPMMGPTWTRVRLILGSDCFPALFQGTVLPLSLTLCFLHCLRTHARCLMSMILGLY